MNKRKLTNTLTFKELSNENEEILNIISQFLNIQIFLKKFKCLSKNSNKLIQKLILTIPGETINLCLQNINIGYFTWQLQKFNLRGNKINSIRFFHLMGDIYLEKLHQQHPSIKHLNICYCSQIKNFSLLKEFHNLETINILGIPLEIGQINLLDIFYYLANNHSLQKVTLSRRLYYFIQTFSYQKRLYFNNISLFKLI